MSRTEIDDPGVASADPAEIRRLGMQALVRELGVAGFLRFMQEVAPGRGDYTIERRAWLDDLSGDDVISQIRQARIQPGASEPGPPPSGDDPGTSA